MSKISKCISEENIYCIEDIYKMLDSFLREQAPFWNKFYSDKTKNIPFFENAPDENLVTYFDNKQLAPKRVLELGCGPGRNAIYMAEKGCAVDAVDISYEAITWARERANEKGISINFICESIFDVNYEEGSYDMVYDSGCLHHIPPHRRIKYVELVSKVVKPGGYFALTCFAGGDEGEDNIPLMSDWEVYRQGSLKGGLGYTEEKLRELFLENFEIIEFRRMKDNIPNTMQGVNFLWVVLFQKKVS